MGTRHSYPPSRATILRAMRGKSISKRGLARALQERQPGANFESMHANVKRWTRANASAPDPKYAALLADILDVDAAAIVKRRVSPAAELRRENQRLREQLDEARRASGGA